MLSGKKRYNIINDSLGWLCFLIAAVTYLLTIEPTASFWDCPEFITQGAKLEVGHPPGNPIFMLTARFFVTIFGGSYTSAAVAVNSMSALLSAATILLLFWTITHFARRLVLRGKDGEPTTVQTVVIMMAGVCGALAYTWSDTFWFSAVEGEVYAFSSFCTALVVWLMIKWENRADRPHSDRYLILIAYVIGISIAVHLLNLLCIPALALIFYYRKWKNSNVKGSLLTLAVSFVIIVLILYGLVPGFIGVAQVFERLFVNGLGMGYNSGVAVYFFLTLAIFIFAVYAFYKQKSPALMKTMFFLSITFSGMLFIGSNLVIGLLLLGGLLFYLIFTRKLPVRVLNLITVSTLVIFIGYSSYALLLIRSNSGVPMNQNQPDNVFALSSYLNREQYGERPLLTGNVFAEELMTEDYDGQTIVLVDENGYPRTKIADVYLRDDQGMPFMTEERLYTKVVKDNDSQPDEYVDEIKRIDYKKNPDLNMLLPRIYSTDQAAQHPQQYKSWAEYRTPDIDEIPEHVRQRWAEQGAAYLSEVMPYLHNMTEITTNVDANGNPVATKMVWKPGFTTNLSYFLNYQLNHMYWRYFMWNFVGRQNDIQGNGEPHLGNWISGISFIDNARLGDQSLLPDEFGKDNKGHNVYFFLPLILGLIGLLWQSLGFKYSKVGIEQFWIVFFLFFMTGIAIVLYLNQTPGQPRERDYAFAGSFYAFAIWIGLGIPAIYRWLSRLGKDNKWQWGAAGMASVVALFVPLQMVSQTWDDHDRSGRYTARDLGENYLNSLDPNAIIFTNGDNDTFPLWYAQEVEGVRTDVKVVNLSYLTTDWYANLLRYPTYDATPVDMYAQPKDYAYERIGYNFVIPRSQELVTAELALKELYRANPDIYGAPFIQHPNVIIETDSVEAMKRFGAGADTLTLHSMAEGFMPPVLDLSKMGSGMSQSKVLSLDMIAKSAANGWKRPIYFATTVPSSYYLGLDDYLYNTGMTMQVTPFPGSRVSPVADKAYENIVTKFRFGGLDKTDSDKLYLDETVRRMVSSTRSSMIKVAGDLLNMGEVPATKTAKEYAPKNGLPEPKNHFDMARHIYKMILEKLPARAMPFDGLHTYYIAEDLLALYVETGNAEDLKLAQEIIRPEMKRYAQLIKYAATLSPDRRAALGANERYALQYLSLMAGLYNRTELLQKAASRKDLDIDKYQGLINEGLAPLDPSSVYPVLYAANPSEKDIAEEIESSSGRSQLIYQQIAALIDLNKTLGVNPAAASDEVLKETGLTRQEWVRASR